MDYSLQKGDFFIPFYIFQDKDLTMSQKVMMAMIHNNSPCTLTNSEIKADLLHIFSNKSQISRIINGLEKMQKIQIRYIQENPTISTKTRVLMIK
jgi:DNA-binding MarR family transcriptional regulator